MSKNTKAERDAAMREFAEGRSELVEVVGTFTDDHVLVGCVVAFGPDKVEVAFPWCGWGMIAALRYAPCGGEAAKDAREIVSGVLNDVDADEDTTAVDDWMHGD